MRWMSRIANSRPSADCGFAPACAGRYDTGRRDWRAARMRGTIGCPTAHPLREFATDPGRRAPAAVIDPFRLPGNAGQARRAGLTPRRFARAEGARRVLRNLGESSDASRGQGSGRSPRTLRSSKSPTWHTVQDALSATRPGEGRDTDNPGGGEERLARASRGGCGAVRCAPDGLPKFKRAEARC